MLPPWLRSSVAAVSSAAASSREEAAVKVAKVFTILAPPAAPLVPQQQRRNITTRASSSSHRRGVHLDTTSPSPSYEHWPPPSSSQHASSSSSSSSHFTFPPASSSQRNRHLLRYLDEDVDVDGHFASFSTLEEQHLHQHQLPTAPRRSQQHHLDSLSDSDLVAHAEQMGRDQLPEEASKLLDYLCGDMRLQQSAGATTHGHAASARLLQTWRRGGDSVTRRRRAAQALLRGAAAVELGGDEGKEPAEGITTLLSPHEVLRVFSILEEQPNAGEPSRQTTSSTQEDPPPPPPPFSFLSPHSGQRLASKLLHSAHPTLFPVFVALFEDLQSRRSAAEDQDAGLGLDEVAYPTTETMIDALLYALHSRVWGQQGGDSFARRAVNALLLQGQQQQRQQRQRQQQQQAGAPGAREMAQLRGAGKDTRAWSSALAADEASMGLSAASGLKDALIFELFTRLLVVRLCLQEGRLDPKIIKEQLREIVAAPARDLRSSSSGYTEQAAVDARPPSATEALSAQYVLDTLNNVLSHGHGSKAKLAVRLASDLVSEHAALVALQAASSAAASSNHNLIIEGEQDTPLEEFCQRALHIKRPGSAIRALLAVKRASPSGTSISLSTLLRPDTLISLISSHRLVERAGYAPAHLHELLGWDQTSSHAAVTEPLVLDLSPSLRPAILRALAFARVKGPLAYLWMRWTDAGRDQASVTASGGVLGAHTIAADTALMKLMVKTFAPSRSTLGAREAGRNSNGSYASQELLSPEEGQRSSVSLPLRSREDEMAFATHVLQAFHRARTSPAEEPLFSPTPSATSTSSDPDTATSPSPTPSPSSPSAEVELSHPQLYDHYDLTTLASAYLDLGREKAAFKLFGELLHRREVPDETDLLVLVYAVATRASRKGAGGEARKRGVREAYRLYERYCMTKPSPSSSKRRGDEPSPPAPAGVHKQLRPTPKLHATLLRLALRAGEFDIARNLALSARKLRFLGGGGGDGENVAGHGHGHGGGGGRGDTQTATTLLLASRAFSPMSFDQAEGTAVGSSGGASPHVRPVWYNLAKLAQSKVRDRSWQPDAELLQHFARAALRGQTSLCSSSPTTNPSTTPSHRRPRPSDNSLRSSLIFLQLASLQTRNLDSQLVEEALVCLQHRARSLANSRRDRSSRGEWGRVVDAFVGGCLRRVELGRGGVGRGREEEMVARDERDDEEEEQQRPLFDHDADVDAESDIEAVEAEDEGLPRSGPASSTSTSTSPLPSTPTTPSSHPLINTLTLRLLAGIYTELRDRSGAYQVALWLRDRRRQRTAAPPASHPEWSNLSEARQAVALLGRGLRGRLASQARSERVRVEGVRRSESESEMEMQMQGEVELEQHEDAWEKPARGRATRGVRQEQPREEVRGGVDATEAGVGVDADAELDRWAEEEQHTRDKPWWKREKWDV